MLHAPFAPFCHERLLIMSLTLSDQIPSRSQVERKLAAASYQIELLQRIQDESSADSGSLVAVESCTSAAINQLLQALTATLDGFNRQLPDPLPAMRVSRRNLRDEFHAVEIQSEVLREIESAARIGNGWLWWLEQKHAGGPFGPLIERATGSEGATFVLLRDPLNLEAGTEPDSPVVYLQTALAKMIELLDRIGTLVTGDISAYRAGVRGQSRRMI